MESFIGKTEEYLKFSNYFGKRKAILTGRDTTALMVLIEEFSEPGGRVILPATCCFTRLASVIHSGRKPVIVDVDENLSMDPVSLSKIIMPRDLVIGVHLFGIPFRYDEIIKIIDKSKAILIEDASQAIGAIVGDEKAGSLGVASIVSFADRKILPTIGGGAILIKEGELHDKLDASVHDLPERPADIKEQKEALLDELKEPFRKTRAGDMFEASQWSLIQKKYPDIYKYKIEKPEARKILSTLGRFDDTVKSRRDTVYLFRKNMMGANIRILDYTIDSAPWRFTIIASEKMNGSQVMGVAEQLKDEGLDVNQLYLPLHWLAPVKCITNGCPMAEKAGTRVINFRVDSTTLPDHAIKAGNIIREMMY